MTGQMKKYRDSLEKSPEPVLLSQIQTKMDLRGLMHYAKEKGKIWINSHYDSSLGAIIVDFAHEGNGYALDDRQLCLQINGGDRQGEIDIPFLMAKKMVLDCGGKLLAQENEDGGSVRTVMFPCS